MSITSDIRNYADTALEQGNQFVGKLTGTARENVTGFTGGVTSKATALTGRATTAATDAVSDLRSQAEKAINLDAIKTVVEPYLAQAKQYRSSVTDRAEGLFGTVRSDKRVARVFTTAESVTGVVVDTVTERVVKPVAALTGRSPKSGAVTTSKPAARKAPAKKAPAKATRPATTRPAAKKAPAAKKSPATKSASAKNSASATARKAPAKKATSSS